jgi:hypothetical protein
MKIALAQFNPTVGDLEGNSMRIVNRAERVKRAGPAPACSMQIRDPIFKFQQSFAGSIPRTYDPGGRVNIGGPGTVGYRYFYA